MAKYLNPFTDFGFKRLFGEEPNKELLKDFLNELLREEQGEIIELQYLKNEQLGNSEPDRKAIFDIYCTNEQGEKFIVELQKTKQKFFKERALYYSTFPIQEQALKGEKWNFDLKAVYTIAILDFVFDDDKDNPAYLNKYRYDVKLIEQETQAVFYDKFSFIYLVMPKFNKNVDELATHMDKWLYTFKHLNQLQEIPTQLHEKIFDQLFQTAEIAQLNRDELKSYENSLKYYRDMKNSLDTAKEEGFIEGVEVGREEGREEGMELGREEGLELGVIQTVKQFKSVGASIEMIQQATGLSLEQIKKL